MSSKSVSLIKKQRLMKDQLRNFPTYGSRSSCSSSFTHDKNKTSLQVIEKFKKKGGLQKGKSLDVQRNKYFQTTFNNIKKTTEKINLKSKGLVKKRKNKTIKQQSFSRVSLLSSQNIISMPSTTTFQFSDSQMRKLSEQNNKYKLIIEKQLNHIKSLQLIISNL